MDQVVWLNFALFGLSGLLLGLVWFRTGVSAAWIISGPALFLLLVHLARRYAFDAPSYASAYKLYDRGEISRNRLDAVRAQDLDASYLSSAVGAAGVLILASLLWRLSKQVRPPEVRPPQVAGQACAVCSEQVTTASEGRACRRCDAVIHKRCAAAHKHESTRKGLQGA